MTLKTKPGRWQTTSIGLHLSWMARKSSKQNKKLSAVDEAKIAHGPPPLPGVTPEVEAEVARLSKEVRRYVRTDIEAQREAVERLMVEGAQLRQMTRILRTQKDPVTGAPRWPNITHRTVRLRMEQVRALRREDGRQNREEMREHMIERLQTMRQRALTQNPPDFKAALECEKQIAKVAGLYAPTKLEVDTTHSMAMVSVIQSMDPELANELLIEAREQERLARKAKELLPAVIDIELEEAPVPPLPAASTKG